VRGTAPPRVSAVVPVFNGEVHVAEAIESLLAQTLDELEVIVVDDGSTDGTPGIVAALARKDERVRVISNERNLGLAAATNRGWRAARADYVARLDADDIALPDRLARQIAFLDANPQVAAVGGAAITINRAGRRIGLVTLPTSSRTIKAQLPLRSCFIQSAVTLRRAVLEAVGGYRFSPGGGYDLWLRLSERFELANLREPVVMYRLQTKDVSPDAVEELARNVLALLVAARRRAAGAGDPLDGLTELGDDVLGQIGVPQEVFERRFEVHCVRVAGELALLGRDAEAEAMLERASRTLGARARRAFRAEHELRAASASLDRGAVVAFGRHLLRASRADVRYTAARTRRRVAELWPA
jgi:Glycosyl transferase family 2